jgi:hypothetical protein
MIRRSFLFILIIMVLSTTGCIKETYDMKKLSKKAHLSPTVGISAIRGNISLSDLIKTGDNVVFDQKFVKLIFKEDSVLDLKMVDFYDLNNIVTLSQTYTIGELSLAPFVGTIGFTLDQISQKLSAPKRSQFVALNGTTAPFPAFPQATLTETTFSLFTNFQNAVFKSGFIDITITNNLTAPINYVSVNLFNSGTHAAIGTGVTIPINPTLTIAPGQTATASVNLADQLVTNSVIAAVVLSGSPGNATPVFISLANSNVQVTIRGRDLKIKSGRVILPVQNIESLGNKDTVSIDPGNGVEIDQVKITTGSLSYHIQSSSPVKASMQITLPTALRSGVPVVESITLNPGANLNGTIVAANTIIDFGADPKQPYNRLPVEYSVSVSSNGSMVNFNSQDQIILNLELLNPKFDYVKGYFGKQVESIGPDSINLEIDDILSHITGEFLISSPSIKMNYSNSFGIPLQIDLKVTGKKKGQDPVDLNLLPFTLTSPVAPPVDRDISSSKTIDKSNSKLPELISMLPGKISYSGSATMNPSGNNGWNNYVFGDSRFIGGLEVEVPLEFRMNSLTFADTMDNFLTDAFDSGSELNWDDFESFKIVFDIENGFPMGFSLKMDLQDSVTHKTVSIDASDLLKPAPVNTEGIATGTTFSSTPITFTHEFFSSIKKADKIILKFTLITSDNGSKDVKIYNDYRIDFKVSLELKPNVTINMK